MAKVFIDPGHGAQDGGASGGVLEKEMVLDIGLTMRSYLKDRWHVDVRMSRDDDSFLELSERANLANAWGADAFVSIHCNAGGGRGFETYRYNSLSSSNLQRIIHSKILNAMRRYGSIPDRGTKSANFAVLRETSMDAVLTENLFVDSSDANFLKRSDFRASVARAHAEGVAQFLSLVPKESDMALDNEDVNAIWNKKFRKVNEEGKSWHAHSLLEWSYGHSARARVTLDRVERKLDALILALERFDSNVAETIRETLADATINVDVNVEQGSEDTE